MLKKYKLALTTGDKKGIGKELVKKSLKNLSLKREDVLIIGEVFDEEISQNFDTYEIKEEDNGAFCYKSLEAAAKFAKEGVVKAIVTSPVSKYELHKSGYIFNGQTEVLESLLAKKNKNGKLQKAQMIFIADTFRVMLLTRHVALKDIKLDKEEIIFQAKILNDFLVEKCKIKSPKIALCALNPHAGEGGILGKEEIEILEPAANALKKEGINITSPKSADALFAKVGKEYLQKEKLTYDAILACYHDQGLCPIKALAFEKAINTTIGLDVIRTSPSSGTAYDIAGQNKADSSSMEESIKLALKLC